MADYDFKYRLASAPAPANDGSGVVRHDIWAVYREQGTVDGFTPVPGRHKTICIPADELGQVLQAGTAGQVVNAYKQALAANLNTTPVGVTGWDTVSLESFMDENDRAAEVAADATEYITVTLGLPFPVEFAM